MLLPALLLSAACTPSGWQEASPAEEAPALYPDYTDIVIPGNIAPLNFNVLNPADACVAVLSAPSGELVLRGPEIRIPEKAWKRLTASAWGSAIQGTVYVRRDGKWLHLPVFRMEVSADDIDPYVTYRLIEPGYSSYGSIVLQQRNLTSFRKRDLYNNQLISGRVEQQCINCHSFQNYGPDNFQFHARESSAGTVVVTGERGKKVAFKTGDLISNAVYPSWHPTEPLIAYSVNKTAQGFLRTDRQKVEVYDSASDLILYDVEQDQVSYIVHDSLSYETFPYWSADGKTLYYASSYLPDWGADPPPTRSCIRTTSGTTSILWISTPGRGNSGRPGWSSMRWPTASAPSRRGPHPTAASSCAGWETTVRSTSGTLPETST